MPSQESKMADDEAKAPTAALLQLVRFCDAINCYRSETMVSGGCAAAACAGADGSRRPPAGRRFLGQIHSLPLLPPAAWSCRFRAVP
jgi:hypothetical protein